MSETEKKDSIGLWLGEPIERLSKEELIEAFGTMVTQYEQRILVLRSALDMYALVNANLQGVK